MSPGGVWSPTDLPVLPGLYLNFQAAALATVQPGVRGTVIMPVKANWGPVRQFVDIARESDIIERFTNDESNDATAYTSLRFALLGGASKVLAYRLADSDAAVSTKTLVDTTVTPVNVLQIDAKYPGTRGNHFTLTVAVNVLDALKKDIKLYEGTQLLRTFTFVSGTVQAAVDAVNNDSGNQWIVATKLDDGNGTLANVTMTTMADGHSGIDSVVAGHYTDALGAFETQEFNVLSLDGIHDSGIQTSVVSWITRLHTEGKMVQAVLGGSIADDTGADAVSDATNRSASYNHEGVVNVGTGAKLNGTSYSSSQVAPYVAGLIASTALKASTTYATTPFQDVTRRWSRLEQEQAVRNGVFLLVHDGRLVKVLRGMNSLVTLRTGQNNGWKKIRTISVISAIHVDLLQAAEDSYIGKVNNTEEGRLALIGAMKQYMLSIAQSGVIEATGYDVILDPAYYGSASTITPAADQVYVQWTAKLTDVMEQIFGTFIVQ